MSELIAHNNSLKKEVELLKIQVEELISTNDHLITATWRERELKKELQQKNKIIEHQHGQITDSINYARRIQKALVVNNEELRENFSDSFIFYKPKDVVSGDFPWLFKKEEIIYFAAVDCTGHGVPGAMLATIGSLLLNDILRENNKKTPAEILDKLHQLVVKTLKQEFDEDAANDGMDIALCSYNTETKELNYAGAYRPLFVFSGGEIKKIKGDSYPIGSCKYASRKSFTNTKVNLLEGDIVYIYSDGVCDQFGGEYDEKYGTKKITEIITKSDSKVNFEQIKQELADDIDEWMKEGDDYQTDDMLLICIKV